MLNSFFKTETKIMHHVSLLLRLHTWSLDESSPDKFVADVT